MNIFIKNFLNQLKNKSQTLAHEELLVGPSWVMINGDKNECELIFKRNNELISSINGKAQIGRWDYLTDANSILLDVVTEKILLKIVFVEKGIFILSKSNFNEPDDNYFVLINYNLIPDLNFIEYLKSVDDSENTSEANMIQLISVKDGTRVRIIDTEDLLEYDSKNQNSQEKDGIYEFEIPSEYSHCEVKNGIIINYFILKKATSLKGEHIVIYCQFPDEITKGDIIHKNGNQIENAHINLTGGKNLWVSRGRVVKIERKISWWSEFWNN